MGDRAQIGFRQQHEEPIIYLYTHWNGDQVWEMSKLAIEKAWERWGDDEYATRIALTVLIGKVVGATGWGVSTAVHGDLGHDVPVIDWNRQIVEVYSPYPDPGVVGIRREGDDHYTFDQWCKDRVVL